MTNVSEVRKDIKHYLNLIDKCYDTKDQAIKEAFSLIRSNKKYADAIIDKLEQEYSLAKNVAEFIERHNLDLNKITMDQVMLGYHHAQFRLYKTNEKELTQAILRLVRG